jgi:centromere protein I
MFGLSLHPLLSGISRSSFAELEEAAALSEGPLEERHSGPVSLRSLVVLSNDGGLDISWEDYRIQVLDWMEKRGLGGVKELMQAIVKNMVKQ